MTDTEIIEALATKVMGWHKSAGGNYWLLLPDHLESRVAYAIRLNSHDVWNPLDDPAHSKQVREKLAERFTVLELSRWGDFFEEKRFRFVVWNHDHNQYTKDTVLAAADTEERAVALCALKSVGVEP